MQKENPHSFLLFFILNNFTFPLMNALVYVDIVQGIHKGKSKFAQNEKQKKLCVFSFYLNVANFEAFGWIFLLSANLLFLNSDISKLWCSNVYSVYYITQFKISHSYNISISQVYNDNCISLEEEKSCVIFYNHVKHIKVLLITGALFFKIMLFQPE